MSENNAKEDPIVFTKETVKIGEGRNLYRYTFKIDEQPVADGSEQVAVPEVKRSPRNAPSR